jgi:hypothetical protein
MSFMPVAGYNELRVNAWKNSDGSYEVSYTGAREELIVSGVATAEMLDSIGVKVYRRGGRRDAEGKRYWLQRYYMTRDGGPVYRYRLWWRDTLSHARMLRMPGALAAVRRSEEESAKVDWDAQDESLQALVRKRTTPERTGLRLVVDNTRRAS